MLKRKKKTEDHPAWRPDFRDVAELPDTKAIRTDFVLNFAAIILVLGLGSWYGILEYSLQTVRASLTQQQEQIEQNDARNRDLLRWNGQFQRLARVAEEAVAFDAEPVNFPEFVAGISHALPPEVVLRTINLGHSETTAGDPAYRIQLDGSVVTFEERSPSAILEALQDNVAELEPVGERLLEMEVADFNRDLALNVFTFSLRIDIEPET